VVFALNPNRAGKRSDQSVIQRTVTRSEMKDSRVMRLRAAYWINNFVNPI
jgi:hypothetical protein